MHKNSLFPFYRNASERNWDQNSHSYKDVHEEKPKRTWIVILTKMCVTKTHKNMDSNSYRDVNDENPHKNNMDSHSYREVHDENPYKNNIDSHSYKDVHEENS